MSQKTIRSSASIIALSLTLAWETAPAFAQEAQAGPSAAPESASPAPSDTEADAATEAAAPTEGQASLNTSEVAEIVVTGFRASLNNALSIKKREAAVVDAIVAEDIAKFPDKNLAESLQRVPGVALTRGDGGEGKQVSVRGLSAAFTRVRLNGMEAMAAVGGSDIQGGINRGRSFDFSVFSSELFSNLTVRKTPSADIEEGSLGATVDLATPHPLDYKDDFTLALSGQGSYNDLARKVDPRATALVSKKFADGTIGVMAAVAYARRHTSDEGSNMVNALRSVDDSGFCSPVGYAPQNPATNPAKGTDALNCATGVPRTANVAAYELINKPTVFHPRQARYLHSDQKYDRLGAALSLQWAPDDDTKVSLDGLYSRFDVDRRDYFLTPISFGRGLGNNGKAHTSVLDASVTPDGTLEYGLFNGVDIRSESVTDQYVTTFKQGVLSASHKFDDVFEMDGLFGFARSILDNPIRTTLTLDAVNTNGFSWDYRGGRRIPILNFGIDVTDPAAFAFGPARPDGTITGIVGLRSAKVRNDFLTAELNATATLSPEFKLRFGGQYREASFDAEEAQRTTTNAGTTPALPAGTTLVSLTRQIRHFGRGLGGDLISGWVAPDYEKFNEGLGLESNSGIFQLVGVGPNSQAFGGNFSVKEKVAVGFFQVEFETDVLPIPLRGNIGTRYVHTDQSSTGYVILPAPAFFERVTVDRSYEDFLPALNLTGEISPSFLLRFSAARVMSRPALGSLNPGGGINTIIRSFNSGNPYLDPVRADTLDFAAEYYFGRGGLISLGLFYKDIESTVQSISTLVPFSETGLPASILEGSQSTPDDLFTVTRATNTDGGPLKGFEINYQQPFTFLPGFLRNFGTLLNYTYVTSEIDYIVGANANRTVTADLTGLSKHSANATLYYEDDRFSIRASANYRDSYLTAVPSGGPDSDVEGRRSVIFVDTSASYAITDQIRFSLEAQNLTDERTSYFIDSTRNDPLYESRTGRTFTAGVAYRF